MRAYCSGMSEETEPTKAPVPNKSGTRLMLVARDGDGNVTETRVVG